MFRQLMELGVVEVNTEPLDARIKRRFKEFWEVPISLVQSWLRKFCGLSKQGLEQAAHTFGIVRSLNLAGESTESIIDCLVMEAFRSSI